MFLREEIARLPRKKCKLESVIYLSPPKTDYERRMQDRVQSPDWGGKVIRFYSHDSYLRSRLGT
jgi:hypothetical protein